MTARIRFGSIGLGGISWAHLPAHSGSEHSELVAVCDLDESLVRAKAEEFGATAYLDYYELLADPRVDAVDITLPHNLHHQVAAAALAAGKHVLVEKPMAMTSAECEDLLSRAAATGLTLSVAENTRFVTAYLEAERLIASGALGDIRLVRTLISGSEVYRLRDTSLWKGRLDGSGGGAIIDAGPHSFYLLAWLFGKIASVRSFHDQLVEEAEVEDNGVVAGRLESGALFRCEFTFTAEVPWDERLEIYGSKGGLIIDQLVDPPARWFQGGGDIEGEALDVPYDPRAWKLASIVAGVQDFAAALAEGRAPTVDPRDGAYAVLIAERAYASAAAGGIALELESPVVSP
jgi:UDP-N-acetylglucosamine 3-dehydrogenase